MQNEQLIQDLLFIKLVLQNVTNKVLIVKGKTIYVQTAIEKINSLITCTTHL